MSLLIAGLAIFFAAHTFTMFRGARQRAVDRFGLLTYRGLYSLFAISGFALIVMGYADAPRIELWAPPMWMRSVAMVLMAPVFVMFVATYLRGHIKARLKNPTLIALKTWAFAHLLANGDLASVLLFGAFLAWAVADLVAVKRSGRGATVDDPRVVYDVVAIVAGLAIYAAVLIYGHVYLAGVPLIA